MAKRYRGNFNPASHVHVADGAIQVRGSDDTKTVDDLGTDRRVGWGTQDYEAGVVHIQHAGSIVRA